MITKEARVAKAYKDFMGSLGLADQRAMIGGGLGGALIGGGIARKGFDRTNKKRLIHRIGMKMSPKYRRRYADKKMDATMSGVDLGAGLGMFGGMLRDITRSGPKQWRYGSGYGGGSGSAYGRYGGGPRGGGPRGAAKAHANLDINLKTVGISKKTTKKSDAKKVYRKRAFEIHPDRNPGLGEEPLKDLNNAWDEIQKTTWFSKLAFILDSRSPGGSAFSRVSLRASLKLAADR
ncbi:MAG: hypothetical protein CL582_21865 [Alteromonadaceae bacterium]|mgnify:CR=1 FL=1|nr:hypothetical protein [Alteromonadaceae bacterium]|tara:strand:- start:638 stop:1339 length:702 start_codon:yes stop_codon:yes gene_type:complete